ncbi:MAG: M16 family metallopeptidase [Gemmatimonadota bacterium]
MKSTERQPGHESGLEQLDARVWRSRLPGGTLVLSERMDSVRSVAIGFWFRQGTAHENADQAGITHLLEHVVFKGTAHRTAHEIAVALERFGGSLDAFTTHEHTSFLAHVPERAIGDAIDVLADLCFAPRLRASDVETEREVVLEEIARSEDTPEDIVFDLHADFLYDGHPYGSPILGTKESVAGLGAGDLRRLHREAFTPGRLIVAAAGAVRHEELVASVSERLPAMPNGSAPWVQAPSRMASGLRRIERDGARQAHIVAGCPGVARGAPLRYAAILVDTAFGGGMSSRLFQRIREERGLAYSVYSFQAFYRRGGHLGAYVGTRPETSDAARDLLLEEFGRLAESGLEPGELETAREQLEGQLMLSLEAPAARMHRLAGIALHDEPYRSLDEVARLVREISAGDAAQAAALHDPDRVAVLELAPA